MCGIKLLVQFFEAVLTVGELMLTKELDRETEQLLAEILQRENTTSDQLIRILIRDRWLSLNQPSIELPMNLPEPIQTEPIQTELEGMAQPQAKQRNGKQTIAEFIRRKRYR